MSKTNDEIIWDFYNFITELPSNEYDVICKWMREREPFPRMAENIIAKADAKRKMVPEHNTNT
ncbi:hypothetical protein [Clostridium sp. HBUAS56010]|uniref:hypothetical protein n=1 Tax=Clostridium sp. HBUAS56010 TaxID=2571127 RepID=UPI001178B764|nr:hypothetical protein [Clostridium sp. HBUAS56010]